MFTKALFLKCKINANIPQSIPNETKKIYLQAVMIRRQNLVDKDNERSSDTKIKYLFQGQSAISQSWFKLDT